MKSTSGSNAQPLVTFEEARALDRLAIGEGLPAQQLMASAAAASAALILREGFKHVHILCGKGNNGGDGYALAWMLLGAGLRPKVYAAEPPVSPEAQKFAELAGRFVSFQTFADLNASHGELAVEALLGSGQRGVPGQKARDALDALAKAGQRGASVLSLDVPAGLTEDAPADWQSLPLPDQVHSYGAAKLACALEMSLCGRVEALPIGFAPAETGNAGVELGTLDLSVFKKRPADHKYTAGSALIAAGTSGMEGAALLAAKSFFAAGGGIAKLCTADEDARRAVLAAEPSLLTGTFGAPDSVTQQTILIGPGLRLEESAEPLLALLSKAPRQSRVVLDGSCTKLILDERYPAYLKPSTVLTPHTGEWAKLGGSPVQCVAGFEAASRRARETGARVLLKGPVSFLFGPERNLVYNAPAPALATAGTGDCLAGILAAALARGLAIDDAVSHSLALLHRSVAGRLHPRASEIPGLIEQLLPGIA